MKLSHLSNPPLRTLFLFLRREGFNSPAFAAMGWIWATHYWTELEHMLKWGTHMKAYLDIVQRDYRFRGKKLSPSQRRQVVLFLQNEAADRLGGV